MLVDSPSGRIAVVEDNEVVGVVTRSDLLAAIGLRGEPSRAGGANLAAELDKLASLTPLRKAIATAGGAFEGIYLVGGSVRDVLLGRQDFDIDIAVEGDAIGSAEELARLLHGRIRAHEKFGTAVVLYGEEARVDVVTTRTEFYDAPAALPSVEHANIREDLFRRDFTVNAMAVSLKAEDYGRLVDPFGGRGDVSERRLRVLHNLSFVDDPTRIFRAVRYESRLGFRMDEHAAQLARSCVEMGLFDDLSSARLRDELIDILDEPDAPRSITNLAESVSSRPSIRTSPPMKRRPHWSSGFTFCVTATRRDCRAGNPDWPCSPAACPPTSSTPGSGACACAAATSRRSWLRSCLHLVWSSACNGRSARPRSSRWSSRWLRTRRSSRLPCVTCRPSRSISSA